MVPELCVRPTKIPDDGTLVPKHVGVDTWYEVCFGVRFITFQWVQFFLFIQIWNDFFYVFLSRFLPVYWFMFIYFLSSSLLWDFTFSLKWLRRVQHLCSDAICFSNYVPPARAPCCVRLPWRWKKYFF